MGDVIPWRHYSNRKRKGTTTVTTHLLSEIPLLFGPVLLWSGWVPENDINGLNVGSIFDRPPYGQTRRMQHWILWNKLSSKRKRKQNIYDQNPLWLRLVRLLTPSTNSSNFLDRTSSCARDIRAWSVSINLQWRAACRLGILVLQVCISICYGPSSNFMGVWVRVIVCAYPCLCLCLWFLCVRVFTCCVCVRAREKKLPGIFYFQGDFTSPHLRAALLWKPVSPLRSFSWKNCPTINRQ